MRYEYILFDLDGTLTDPKEGITKCVQYALKSFGIKVTDLNTLTCFIGPPLLDSFQDYFGFSKEDAQTAIEKYRERFRDIGIFENRVYDGVPEMLERLRQHGAALAVASSKPRIFVNRILEKYQLAKYFQAVGGSELDGSCSKKDEVIDSVFSMLNISKDKFSKTAMIGDRRYDIQGAKEMCISAIGVRFGYADEGELEKAGADFIAEDVQTLSDFLINSK